MPQPVIRTLFLDIGGVLLTNAWGRESRALAAQTFNLDAEELDERHHLCFDTYEMGKLSLDDYLNQIVFYQKRNFTPDDFKAFIYSQSVALEGCMDFFKELKAEFNLRVFAVNNEAKELNEYRITHFKLHEIFDAFISSCYVGLRKPDKDIFNFACNIAQTKPGEALIIDDREMFVEVAAGIGLNAFRFENLESAKDEIRLFFANK